MEQRKNIFISYAKEDFKIAKKLYDNLRKEGFNTWIDAEDILPGQNWKRIIIKNIQKSRFFIILLSNNSLNKRGFVQKELKIALDILDEFPSDDIFIIPIRLEKCIPKDERLKNLHWADFFPSYDNGLKKLLKLLHSYLDNNEQSQKHIDLDIEEVEIPINDEIIVEYIESYDFNNKLKKPE